MPIYDMHCPEHGYYNDILCSIEERHSQRCPVCGASLRIIPMPVQTIGPMPSKPVVISQIGRTFESAGELRDYQRANPDCRLQSREDFQRHKDEVREKCEGSAKRNGFRDLEEQTKVRSAAKEAGVSVREL